MKRTPRSARRRASRQLAANDPSPPAVPYISRMCFGSFDTSRFVGLPGYAGTATASTSLYSIGARLRAGYEVSFQDWYVRPYVDLDLIHTHSPSYNESGPAPSLTWIRPPSSPLPP